MPTLSAATQQAEAIARAVLKSRKQALVYSKKKQDDLIALYSETARELQREISFYAEDDGSLSFRRLQALLGDTNKTIEVLGGIRDKQLERGIRDSVRMGIETYKIPLEIAGLPSASLSTSFGLIHQDTVEALHDFIAADGLKLSDRLWRLTAATKRKVEETIQQAIIKGESSRETAQKLITPSGQVGSDVADILTQRAPGNVVHSALRISRTELARANNEGFLRTGEKISVVAGNRWNLTGSHPRVDICDTYATQDVDGLGAGGYKSGNYPSMAHPECMCYPTPIFSFELETAKK